MNNEEFLNLTSKILEKINNFLIPNSNSEVSKIVTEVINSSIKETMPTKIYFLIIILGGLFGGILYFIHKTKVDRKSCYYDGSLIDKKTFIINLLFCGIIGIGGAFSLVVVRELNTSSVILYTTKEIIYNFALFVVAGFAAKTLLPSIANKLEKQLNQQQEIVNKNSEEINEQKRMNEEQNKILKAEQEATKILMNLMKGESALREDALPSDIERGIACLKENLYINSADRTSAILLARIYSEKSIIDDKIEELNMGINVLNTFLSKQVPNEKDYNEKDCADINYNLSCHMIELSEKLDGEKREQTIKKALEILKKSIELSNENILDAEKENEFTCIKEREDFKLIVPNFKL